jgi:hypothetical protein
MKFWQVMANCSDTRRFTDSFTDSGHSDRRNSFVLNEVEMEARVGIEPTHTAFAEPRLTTWLPRLPSQAYQVISKTQVMFGHLECSLRILTLFLFFGERTRPCVLWSAPPPTTPPGKTDRRGRPSTHARVRMLPCKLPFPRTVSRYARVFMFGRPRVSSVNAFVVTTVCEPRKISLRFTSMAARVEMTGFFIRYTFSMVHVQKLF